MTTNCYYCKYAKVKETEKKTIISCTRDKEDTIKCLKMMPSSKKP